MIGKLLNGRFRKYMLAAVLLIAAVVSVIYVSGSTVRVNPSDDRFKYVTGARMTLSENETVDDNAYHTYPYTAAGYDCMGYDWVSYECIAETTTTKTIRFRHYIGHSTTYPGNNSTIISYIGYNYMTNYVHLINVTSSSSKNLTYDDLTSGDFEWDQVGQNRLYYDKTEIGLYNKYAMIHEFTVTLDKNVSYNLYIKDVKKGSEWVFPTFSQLSVNADPTKYTLDVNGQLDGVNKANTTGFGTFDVYVNGESVANDVSEFNEKLIYGDEVYLKDVKSLSGYNYTGVTDTSFKTNTDGSIGPITMTSDKSPRLGYVSSNKLTVNPNGGIYLNSGEIQVYEGFEGDSFNIEDPVRSGYGFLQES